MRFGIATIDITPDFPTNLYGYAGRSQYYQGVHDRLQFTALVLEECGSRIVIGAGDLGVLPNDARTLALRTRVGQIVNCPVDHVLLNCSHSHGAVFLQASSGLFFTEFDHAAADQYFDWLADRIAQATQTAVASLQPGTLGHTRGVTNVPINRRREKNGQICLAPNPEGPIDGALDVLTLHDDWGRLAAVGLRMGCHPVSVGPKLKISADFIGAWRRAAAAELGTRVQTFFLQGAGGDARPRHTVDKDGTAFQYLDYPELEAIGRDLCAEMVSLLRRPARVVGGSPLRGTLQRPQAGTEPRYTDRASVAPLLASDEPEQRRFARACLALLDQQRPVPTSVTCQVQTLWLDHELALVGLDNEPLCRLGHAIERALEPRQAMVLGYCNGTIGYAPDTHELHRGGYESRGYLYEPWSGPFLQGFEHVILPALDRSSNLSAR